jgi:proline dehydrogenase
MRKLEIPDTQNTVIAFRHLSDFQLRKASWLFAALGHPTLSQAGQKAVLAALRLRLPVEWMIKNTVFSQFCGGETIHDCKARIEELWRYKVGAILDYAAEGLQHERDFEQVCAEVQRTIRLAADHPAIPFCVFKVTGVARLALLEKVSSGATLQGAEHGEWQRCCDRVARLCALAAKKGVRLFIDAEESWIQSAIDELVYPMMSQFNRERVIVYNTLQMYRKDRLEHLQLAIAKARDQGYKLGFKLVRGAYLEKEGLRAAKLSYPNPLFREKKDTDSAYDRALELCIRHVEMVSLVAGTHNEYSTLHLVRLMAEEGLAADDDRVHFSQLLGMSDHLSFNLADAGFNVAKYVPYGQVQTLIPYLVRRAQENSAMRGQMSRELLLLQREQARRSGRPGAAAVGFSMQDDGKMPSKK